MNATPALTGVSKTAVWTLRARSDEHSRPDRLFDDSQSVKWYGYVSEKEESTTPGSWYTESLQTTIAIRTKIYDDAVVRFLASHESPVVVELGAGFSTRYSRLADEVAAKATCRWIELDLSEIIALRGQLETETPAHQLIAASVLDFAWIEQLPKTPPEAILFVAEGLFMFLGTADRQQLVENLRRSFPGASLLLDVSCKITENGESVIAAAQGVHIDWLVDDEDDIAAMGLTLTQVWPLLAQYPERIQASLNGMSYTSALRNAALLVEAHIPAWDSKALQHINSERDVAGAEAEPLWFRGNAYRAAKQFVYGTHRACPPEETLERIRPQFRQVGITRIADITGLDRIGIPVTLAIRPNAPTMSNSTGKGFTLTAAIVSGAMESIEIYHAENAKLNTVHKTYNELIRHHRVFPLELLPRIKNDVFHPDLPEEWAFGWDIIQQEEVAVPVSMVNMSRDNVSPSTMINFQIGSNGLASGNHLPEAVAAGLLEVIERDAIACQQTAWRHLNVPPPKVKLDTIESVPVQDLLRRFEAANIRPSLFEMTVDTQIPVYMAYVYDLMNPVAGIAAGYGAHLDPEIAMIRALTEAAQSRVVLIAGSRDEHFRHHHMLFKKLGGKIQTDRLETAPEIVDLCSRHSMATLSFEGDIAAILERLKAVGRDRVILFELTLPGFDISVVRVAVPGLEGYMFAYYVPGTRARNFLRQRKAELAL